MRRSGIAVFPGFQLISLAAVPVFELANALRKTPVYDLRLISEAGGAMLSSGGVSVQTEALEQPRFDTILVVGGASRLPVGPAMIAFMASAAKTSRRVTATCTGAFVPAAAGLLDGKRATTHWQYAHALRQAYPRVRVEEDRIFIKDGAIWTTAGMTAVIDLALGHGRGRSRPGHFQDRGASARGLPSSRGRPIAAFDAFGARTEIGSRPKRARLRQTPSAREPFGRATRGDRAAQPPAIQPRFPHGDREVPSESRGAAQGGSGATDVRGWRSQHRGRCPRNGVLQSRAVAAGVLTHAGPAAPGHSAFRLDSANRIASV